MISRRSVDVSETVQQRLEKQKIQIPDMAPPAANYVPWVITGDLVFISGQVPVKNGKIAYQGKVGKEVNPAEAVAAARLVGLNILGALKAACGGDLERVTRCVKLGGFVNCIDSFDQQPMVINGASDLMVEVFGDRGKHARFAVGTNVLPFDVPVEIDAIFEID
jgi:enamine deaminase RidA (YjgF/YER057c/UK114 family)